MRKFLLVLFFISLNYNAYSQWFWQNPLPQGNSLNSVKFINDNTGWAVGNKGTIIKTINAGVTWTGQISICDSIITDVFFVDSLIGYACSNSSMLLKTTNGGQNWILKILSGNCSFNKVYFSNANTGYLSGADYSSGNGILLKTTNGGNNWTNIFISPYTYSSVDGFYVYSNNIIYAASGDNELQKTNNAGINWMTFIVGWGISKIYFPDTLNGLSFGGYSYGSTNYGIINKTTNGGNNFYSVLNSQDSVFTSYSFINSLTGYVSGYSGTIRKTTNLGTSWMTLNSSTSMKLNSIDFPNSNTGYSVGDYGMILKTTNTGTNWNSLYKGTQFSLYINYFINENTGFSGGDYVLLKTTNGGLNWITKLDTNIMYVKDIKFINENTGFILSSPRDRWSFIDSYLLKTTNNGENWNINLVISHSMYTNFELRSLSMINANTGWICGLQDDQIHWPYTTGMYLKTTNGGLNWTYFYKGYGVGLSKIFFSDNNNGLLFDDSVKVYKTSNAGINWNETTFYQSQNHLNFASCYFINSSTGWISYYKYYPRYSLIFKTTNGGNNWISQDSVYDIIFYSLFADSVGNCWAVGSKGDLYTPILSSAIYSSSNGGNNWIRQRTPTDYCLNSVYFVNKNTGWIVGNSGTIIKTTSGITSGIKPSSQMIPKGYILFQNYPNPFNPVTTIRYAIPRRSPTDPRSGTLRAFGDDKAVLKVYDVLGKEIETLVNEKLQPGTYSVEWNASQLPSGVYFYQLRTGDYIETKKMILLK